jgi:hypothetical protein
MRQRLQARGVTVTKFPFTNENLRRLFGVPLDLIRTSRLRCRPHEALQREQLSLEAVATAPAQRPVAVSVRPDGRISQSSRRCRQAVVI